MLESKRAMTRKQGVLFLCTHNAARSQMAEARLRHLAPGRFDVASAGLAPTAVHPMTLQVLIEAGVDVNGLRAKGVNEFLGKASIQYAVVVCGEDEWQSPRLFPFAIGNLRWPFEDAVQVVDTAGERLAAFRRVPDAIEARLRAGSANGGANRECDRTSREAPAFRLVEAVREQHVTPEKTVQAFQFSRFVRIA
jgi:arsenate reductase